MARLIGDSLVPPPTYLLNDLLVPFPWDHLYLDAVQPLPLLYGGSVQLCRGSSLRPPLTLYCPTSSL